MVLKVKKTAYSGGTGSNDAGPNGLAAQIRALAIDMARVKFDAATYTPPTDSSGGTNQTAGLPAMAIPSADFDASAAGGVTVTALNAQVALIKDGQGQMGTYLNTLRASIGLPALTGALTTVGTIAAQAASATGGTGNATPTRATVVATFTAIRNNYATLAKAANEVAAALDYTRLTDSSGGSKLLTAIAAVPDVVASTTGANSVSKVTVDAFLAAQRNALKTLTTYVFLLDDVAVDAPRIIAAD